MTCSWVAKARRVLQGARGVEHQYADRLSMLIILPVVLAAFLIGFDEQRWLTGLTAAVASAALSGGLAEVIFDDQGEPDRARRAKAITRMLALPSTFAAVGLVALTSGADANTSLGLAVLAIALPASLTLLLIGRFVAGLCLAALAIAGLVYLFCC